MIEKQEIYFGNLMGSSDVITSDEPIEWVK